MPANHVDPGKILWSMVSDLDLHCSSMSFLAHLYESIGRAIAVTTMSVSLKMLKIFKACIS